MSDPDALAALRDLHAVSLPSIDPLLLAAIAGGLLLALGATMLTRWLKPRGGSLRREAARALAQTCEAPASQRLSEQAKLLRRLARTLGGEQMARLRGDAWLAALDQLFATRFFTTGAGRCFGDALYAADAGVDLEVVAAELALLVRRLGR